MKKAFKCNCNIKKAIRLADELKDVADEGEEFAGDNSCLLLYGVIRDCSYRIREIAEQEKQSHKNKGMWD
jgi:hypothetical protein